MANLSLHKYLHTLVDQGLATEAVALVRAILQQLPVGAEGEQISREMAKNPTDWVGIGGRLEKCFAAQNISLVIGNDNISFQNVYGATISVIKLVVPRPLAHHLNPIPSINPAIDCIGRESELAELDEQLNTSNKVALVRGLGGIGKTTLAQAYVALHQGQYQHLVWITQGEDLRSTVALDQSLAESLGKPYQAGEDLSTRFVQLMQALRSIPGPNLLVIDNATAQLSEPELLQYLPTPPHWKVLVTSREYLPDFVQLELQVLRPAAALELFRRYYGSGTDEEAMELLAEIGYHTLMIELMAKTLERQSGLLSIPELLANFRDRKLDDPDLEEKLSARHSGKAEKGLFQYLMRLFTLTGLSAEEVWVMQQFAVLPAVPIRRAFLAEWLIVPIKKEKSSVWWRFWTFRKKEKKVLHPASAVELNRILNGLSDKGWLRRVEEGFVVHRLVQELVKYRQAPGVEELEALVEAMNNKMFTGDYGNPVSDNFPYLPYAEKVATYFSNNEILPQLVNPLWSNLGLIYQKSGDYSRSAHFLERALESAQKQLEPSHPIVAVLQSNLGNVLNDLSDYNRATELLEMAIESDIKTFGSDHYNVAIGRSNLAKVYFDSGNFSNAVHMYELALKHMQKLGSKHPKVAVMQSNLATVYRDLGNHQQSILLLEQALQSDLENLGPNHPNTTVKLSNLALMYQDLGQYQYAIQLLEQALQSDFKNFGHLHPTIATKQTNLATAYHAIGEYSRSAELFETALQTYLQNFGLGHPSVARCQSNLALVYLDLKRYNEAEGLLIQASQAFERLLGKKHPNTLIVTRNLEEARDAIQKSKS